MLNPKVQSLASSLEKDSAALFTFQGGGSHCPSSPLSFSPLPLFPPLPSPFLPSNLFPNFQTSSTHHRCMHLSIGSWPVFGSQISTIIFFRFLYDWNKSHRLFMYFSHLILWEIFTSSTFHLSLGFSNVYLFLVILSSIS